jgi:hypothetical protein
MRNGRNVGKLAQLMNMPLDVFFEVRHPRLLLLELTDVDLISLRLPVDSNL